ncbi:MAG: hypothetical protein H7Z13_04340 [Ferruginibacter sp.]|nr:hypothetical protein [Ferruginibacter sp.]
MEKQLNSLFTSLNRKELAELAMEVKETIAFGLTSPRRKNFTAADLWNIHRQLKPRVQRRYL